MTPSQKTVAIGALSGIIAMALSVWLLQELLPQPHVMHVAGDRVAYALQWNARAALPLFAMVAAVGNARFGSQAIDPTRGAEDARMIVNGRVADNTTQQFLLFLAGSTALAAGLPPGRMTIIGAAAITFVIARVAFWIGYRIHPLYRAPGFAATMYLNLGLLAAAIWMAVD